MVFTEDYIYRTPKIGKYEHQVLKNPVPNPRKSMEFCCGCQHYEGTTNLCHIGTNPMMMCIATIPIHQMKGRVYPYNEIAKEV